ncbi:heavy metal transporter [Pseudoclavibacter sp. RFBJ3]|uniref:heavy-metal-associated domain-containing protein n=1 Tax=unclassified Pseudoclavibacter TaxID=2615177 RepID=UPI000CE85857|nr:MULTISPECIES: heavy-metal-associated domain-containing protein [unclassified Pseudoclavibacter]MBF4551842.1 heavy-metal-associated domain-containing protein [Pseudoclavibacter sp. VKM Ac-2888]PPF37486.1 heavy metal transporter [Pseudoclavibacter sp. AY1H1]PPF76905.1 heavy metal transporter [Pseudoclavibacter sp. Z016]PPF85436.1 heavy metal transporter [Pseudoclavibacter sp. RFBJ5]PPF93170.1 heavy metal transporter [Pseudoclavibacter sp. RFBJ3]
MTTTTYQVTGMTCAHCERAVTQEVSDLAGVASVDVSAETGRLVVESAEPLDDAAVIAAVDEAGYAATRA